VKQSRWALNVWLPACALATLVLWLGCEQKGDISPTGATRHVLTFIDTVIVDPPVVVPGGTATLGARILNEANEPAVSENVKFSVSRGSLCGTRADTTVVSNAQGWARTTFTAPSDTGGVLVRTELLSMSEMRTATMQVSSTPSSEGMLTLHADRDSLVADNGASSTKVYARLRNENHNPIPGAVVYFTTSIGSITSPATTDSLTGTAMATLVSTTDVGQANITARYGTVVDSLHIVFTIPAPAGTITLTTTRPQLQAGTDSTVITARVFDTANLPVIDNTQVFFSTTAGTLSRLTARTQGGMVTTVLYAPPAAGEVRVTATTTGNVSNSIPILVMPGAAATIGMTASLDTLFADATSEAVITALVRDAFANPVLEGTPVAFTAQGGSVTTSATVGTDGRAIATFRAGLAVGPATINATQNGKQGSVTIQLRGTIPASISLTAAPLQMVANGSSVANLRATVLDAEGRPVSDGTQVTFVAQHGTVGGITGGTFMKSGGLKSSVRANWSNALDKKSVSRQTKTSPVAFGNQKFLARQFSLFTATTVGGFATAEVASSTAAGLDTVTATAGSRADQQILTYVAGPAALIQVVPQDVQLPADGISMTSITCQVTDAFGNPVGSGLSVSLTASIGSVSPASGYTNVDGIFHSSLITTRQRGLCAVVATTQGASGYGEVQFVAPQVSSVIVLSDANSILANGVSVATLTALASDAFGLPIPGASLTWQAAPGLGRLIPTSNIADSAGRATAIFISGASRTDADQTITVQSGTHTGQRSIHLLGVTLDAWTDVSLLPGDGTSTTNVNVLVRESASGFAIANATVRFAASTGSIVQTGVTNNNGQATASYHSPAQSGQVAITAIYGDTLRAETGLRLTSTAAETLVVTLNQTELLADGVSSTPVTATVYNEGGQTVPNTPVTFTAVGGGTFVPAVVNSDSSGHAVAMFRSVASTTDIPVALDIAIVRSSDQKQMMLRGVNLNMSSPDESLPANGTATTQIRIDLRRTSTFVAVPGASVILGTSLGTVPALVSTDSSGIATATFTAGNQTGTAEIIARYGNMLTDTVRIDLFAPSAAQIELSASRVSLLGNGADSTIVTTRVTDQRGASLRNAVVRWSVSGNGSVVSSTTMTDTSGIASTIFVSPAATTDQMAQVTAEVGTATNNTSLAVRGVTLSVSAVTSSLPANGIATTQIRAHLLETTSSVAIATAPIHFGATRGSIAASAMTDISGMATVTLTAPATSGAASIYSRYGNLLTDTALVNFYTPSPQRIVVFADTSLLRADGISRTPVHAFVYDETDIPMGNVTVRWAANLGRTEGVETTTDAAGMTWVMFLTTASIEDRNIIVTAAAGTAEGTTQVLTRGVTVEVSAVPQTVVADGSSTSQIRTHVFETSTSVAVSGMLVTLGTSMGTIANLDTTDETGVATTVLHSITQTGTAVVTASVGSVLSAQTSVTFAPSTPTTLSLTASPTVLLADNISTSNLTSVLTDQNGNPVPNGTQVRYSLTPQNGSMENLRTTHAGVALNALTSSSTPDTVVVRVWADANPSVRDSATVIYIVGTPSVVTLSAQRDTLNANGIALDTITAHVTDAVGHLLPNVDVRFTSTIGNITASNVTDAYGNAKVAFSSSHTGTAQITATASGALGVHTVYLIPGTPNSITMEYSPSSVGVRGSGRNETLLITATVRDANNNPVMDGTNVYFNINNSPGGGDFLSSTGAVPTINGRATVSYNSGTAAGSARVRANCGVISAVSTEILVYAGPPYIEDIHNPCETSHMSLASSPCSIFGMDVVGDSTVLVALVGDRYNNPVTTGTAVYFTTSAGVITTATGYTDSLGFARVTLYSGHPLPSIDRWRNTLNDPNTGTEILCTAEPPQPGVAKIVASSAGVDAAGDSVTVWASTEVTFTYSQPILELREASVNGDRFERTLFIGQAAIIRFATYDPDFWPLAAGSMIHFSASHGSVYPDHITIGCPGDTSYTVTFFNSLSLTDQDAASPVLINVDTRFGSAYTFTETFTLRASLPPAP
jgi:adhesin/invasin